MDKNRFLGVQNGSQSVEMGILGGVFVMKVVLEFWFGHPKCHFWYPQNDQKGSFWGYQKWHGAWCPNQNSESTFIDQNHPQNPQKDTLGTQIGPRKVIFSHFLFCPFSHWNSHCSRKKIMGRKGPRAKTKIVPKSVKQWEQLGNMHNWKFRNFWK